MESDDMDISASEEEEDDDDDDPELEKLLSSLSGMEKCFLPIRSESENAKTTQEKQPILRTPISNDINYLQDRAETPPRTPASFKRRVRSNSIISISPVSPANSEESNHSNASTLSRDGTPEKQTLHCQKDCDSNQVPPTNQVTVAQLLEKDSDSDVIIDCVTQHRKDLETGASGAAINLNDKSVNNSTLSNNSGLRTETNNSIVLDLDKSPTNNIQPVIVPPAVISTETQFRPIDPNSPSDDDSDSDCLIVEHIAASDYRQNGLIDLTKPTSDEEASLPLQERTEESLLKEISKIRKALTKTKQPKNKKHHKKGKKKHKSTKKKKRSKSKGPDGSPSLDKVSDSDDDRTITMSESGRLSVNIPNDQSRADSEDSGDSAKTTKSTRTILPEGERNRKTPPKDSNRGKNLSSTIEKSFKDIEKNRVVNNFTSQIGNSSTVEKSKSVVKPTYTDKKSTSIVEKSTTIEKSANVVKKSTSAIEKSTSAIESSTTAVEKSTSAIESSTAAVEKSTTIENTISSKKNDAELNALPENVETNAEDSPPLWNSDRSNGTIEEDKTPLRNPDPFKETNGRVTPPIQNSDISNKTNGEDSPPLWNSDGENAEETVHNPPPPSQVAEWNPLRKKLANSFDDNNVRKPYMKKIFCDSGKEMKSNFRRKSNPGSWNPKYNKKGPFGFNLPNKFKRNSEDDDGNNENPRPSFFSRRSVPPQRMPPEDKFNNEKSRPNFFSRRSVPRLPPRQGTPPDQDLSSHPSRFLLQNVSPRLSVCRQSLSPPNKSLSFRRNVHSRRSVPPRQSTPPYQSSPAYPSHQNAYPRRSVPPNDRFDKFLSDSDSDKTTNTIARKKPRLMVDSDDDKINTVGTKSPDYGIAGTYYRARSKSRGGSPHPLLHRRKSQPPNNHRSRSRSPSYPRISSYRSPSPPIRSKFRRNAPPTITFQRGRSISKSNSSDELSFFNVYNKLRDPSRAKRSKSRVLLLNPTLQRRSKSRALRSPSFLRRSPSIPRRSPSLLRRSPSIPRRSPSLPRRSPSLLRRSPSIPRRSPSLPRRSPSLLHRSPSLLRRSPSVLRRSPSLLHRSPSLLRRSKSRSLRSPSQQSRRSKSRSRRSPRSHRSKSRSMRSPSWSRRSRSFSISPLRSRTHRSPSRSWRSKSRAHRSPSRSRRSKSRTYRSPSRSRRSRSRTHRSHSRSHRSKSRRRTPRRRSESRSPSEIRAARKCSPLESMRQQLRKNNEAAVRQALGSLEQPKQNPPPRIIADLDLTESPSPERIPTICNLNTTTFDTAQAVSVQQQRPLHPYNATALGRNYTNFMLRAAGSMPMHPHPGYLRMPVRMVRNPSGILSQTNVFQISHVFSQATGLPENYMPVYQPPPPYM